LGARPLPNTIRKAPIDDLGQKSFDFEIVRPKATIPFGKLANTTIGIRRMIEERLDAVEEVAQLNSEDDLMTVINSLLSLPDLERGITRIYYQKCTFDEFITILNSFKKYDTQSNNLY